MARALRRLPRARAAPQSRAKTVKWCGNQVQLKPAVGSRPQTLNYCRSGQVHYLAVIFSSNQ